MSMDIMHRALSRRELRKFLKGIPAVGILSGAAKSLYYRKVMEYVQSKCWKRYLLRQLE